MRNQCDHIITAIYIYIYIFFFVQIKQHHNNINQQKKHVCVFLVFEFVKSVGKSPFLWKSKSVGRPCRQGTSQMTPWDSDWAGGTEGLKRDGFFVGG